MRAADGSLLLFFMLFLLDLLNTARAGETLMNKKGLTLGINQTFYFYFKNILKTVIVLF
jgi:hypothetical protein